MQIQQHLHMRTMYQYMNVFSTKFFSILIGICLLWSILPRVRRSRTGSIGRQPIRLELVLRI